MKHRVQGIVIVDVEGSPSPSKSFSKAGPGVILAPNSIEV